MLRQINEANDFCPTCHTYDLTTKACLDCRALNHFKFQQQNILRMIEDKAIIQGHQDLPAKMSMDQIYRQEHYFIK